MTEVTESEERGLGLSAESGFPVVEPYGKVGGDGYLSPTPETLRNGTPETFLCPGCGRVIDTLPTWEHNTAERDAVEGMKICPACRSAFHSKRASHLYCSDSCQRKGSRLGKANVESRMENDDLMRRCALEGCDNSLIGRTARSKYCSTKHRVKAAYWKGA